MCDYAYIEMTYQYEGNMSQQIYNNDNLDCAKCAKELKLASTNCRVSNRQPLILRICASRVWRCALLRCKTHTGFWTHAHEAQPQTPRPEQRGGIVGFWDYLLSRHDTRLTLIGADWVFGLFVSLADT
jgi:hypothetical protein